MTVPIALIVDDGGPVNPAYFLHMEEEHEFIIPNSFTRDFADVCAEHGVKGKFSVIPMPSCLGRLDGKLNYVSKKHLHGFLETVRRHIAPAFDITPEILTHLKAVNLKQGGFYGLFENAWVKQAGVAEMTDYIALALRILDAVGLPANGVTSPWDTGIHNEKQYAEAIGRAFWRVHRKKFSWYFLHCLYDSVRSPWLSWQDKKIGLKVVSVPGTSAPGTFGGDAFWGTQGMRVSMRARWQATEKSMDALLGPNGKTGRIRYLFERKCPIVIVTHWQSLFSDGTAVGLRAFEIFLKRIKNVFGNRVEWTRCSDLARQAIEH